MSLTACCQDKHVAFPWWSKPRSARTVALSATFTFSFGLRIWHSDYRPTCCNLFWSLGADPRRKSSTYDCHLSSKAPSCLSRGFSVSSHGASKQFHCWPITSLAPASYISAFSFALIPLVLFLFQSRALSQAVWPLHLWFSPASRALHTVVTTQCFVMPNVLTENVLYMRLTSVSIFSRCDLNSCSLYSLIASCSFK